eukprot:1004962-Pleurochrysis_carterae.AAC.2
MLCSLHLHCCSCARFLLEPTLPPSMRGLNSRCGCTRTWWSHCAACIVEAGVSVPSLAVVVVAGDESLVFACEPSSSQALSRICLGLASSKLLLKRVLVSSTRVSKYSRFSYTFPGVRKRCDSGCSALYASISSWLNPWTSTPRGLDLGLRAPRTTNCIGIQYIRGTSRQEPGGLLSSDDDARIRRSDLHSSFGGAISIYSLTLHIKGVSDIHIEFLALFRRTMSKPLFDRYRQGFLFVTSENKQT